MKKKYLLLSLLFSASSFAANVEPIRDAACPDKWIFTDKAIPMISSSTNPWGQETNDKDQAKTHLSNVDVVETISAFPVTNDDLVNDPLTVASECLIYKNMLVDGVQYYPPSPSVPRNRATGFIPASVF
ncbi:MAG: hypothetical protein ACI9SP_002776 [Arenicella sp.]|jgi:hypothetical protein